MRKIYGLDGCKKGWVAVAEDLESGLLSWDVYNELSDLLKVDLHPVVIAIDIPIGLPEKGARSCDREARRLLGQPRGSSVFPAPLRPVLKATEYEEACQIRQEIDGKQMSKQAYNILNKTREVDALLRQDMALQKIIHEVHPEVCFYTLAGNRPMSNNKKKPPGQQERTQVLPRRYVAVLETAVHECGIKGAAPDDVLDAFAALWSAGRIARGEAINLPAIPPRDSVGLRMEIVV